MTARRSTETAQGRETSPDFHVRSLHRIDGVHRQPAVFLALSVVVLHATSQAPAARQERPGTAIEYRIERLADTGRDLEARFAAEQVAVLEKLNRADAVHLRRLDRLVVPSVWMNELDYSPFPLQYPAAARIPKLLVVDQPTQAFAAYEEGRLVRWGPVSSGRQARRTPSGMFHLNWRSKGRHSSVTPRWYMKWYFNFDNVGGRSLHSYALPGYPASHSCIRLLERDAMWLYEWGEPWTLDARGEVATPGTPLLIIGQYAFAEPPPWRSPEYLARGIGLPVSLTTGSYTLTPTRTY